MKTKTIAFTIRTFGPSVRVLAALSSIPLLAGSASAQSTWATPGTNGNWDLAGNWSPSGIPTSATAVIIDGNGGQNTIVTISTANASFNSLTIGLGDKVLMSGGTSRTIGQSSPGPTMTNAGTFSLDSSSGSPWLYRISTVTNTGIIENIAGYSRWDSSGTITNTGGQINVSGGRMGFKSNTITGGTVTVASGATFAADDIQAQTTLTDLTMTNAGTITYDQNAPGSSRTMFLNLRGTTSLTNTNLMNVTQSTAGGNAPNSYSDSVTFSVGGTASFTNGTAGTLNLSNASTVGTNANQNANAFIDLDGTAGITVTNDGNINLSHTSAIAARYTNLRIKSNVTLGGSGTTTLSDNINNRVTSIDATGGTLTNGANQTLKGAGQLGVNSINLINNGTIEAGGATVQLEVDPKVTFANAGTFKVNGVAGAKWLGGTYTNSGTLQVDASRTLDATASGVTYSTTNTTTINGAMDLGSNAFTQTAGATTVSGTLTASAVNINGGTLRGSGTIVGNVTISTGAFLAPGNSPDQIDITGSLGLNPGSFTTMEIDGTVRGATGYDAVDVSGALAYGGTLSLDFGVLFNSVGTYTFDLFNFTSHSSSFSAVNLADQYSGALSNNGFGVWSTTISSNTWTFDQGNGNLILTVVPEPTTSTLAGLFIMAGLLRRRR